MVAENCLTCTNYYDNVTPTWSFNNTDYYHLGNCTFAQDCLDQCELMGLQPISIHSAAENSFMSEITNDWPDCTTATATYQARLWIGFSWQGDNVTYWRDGSPWDYTTQLDSQNPTQPLSFIYDNIKELCSAINKDSTWNDINCLSISTKASCICMRRLPNYGMDNE